MAFYERERNKKTRGLQEIPVDTTISLKSSVLRGEHVSRVAKVIDPNTLQIEHHLFGFAGIQQGSWPVKSEYTGAEVNNASLWKENMSNDNSRDTRIIWKPETKS